MQLVVTYPRKLLATHEFSGIEGVIRNPALGCNRQYWGMNVIGETLMLVRAYLIFGADAIPLAIFDEFTDHVHFRDRLQLTQKVQESIRSSQSK